MKVLCFGICDRDIRVYKMEYYAESVPQYCEGGHLRRFKILVQPNHLFYFRKKRFFIFTKIYPAFIFNMLNRKSLREVKDKDGKIYLGESIDLHPNQEQIDAKTANTLDYLTHSAFWSGLRSQFQLDKMQILVIMGAGIGIWEVIKQMLTMVL